MIRNYLKIALRNMRKQKFYTTINVLGLAIGVASSLFISWYVIDEFSYDQFHQQADQVYRVTTRWGDDPQTDLFATTPPPLYEAIKAEIPEVETVARAFTWNHSTMRLPKEETENKEEVVFRETKIYIVDPEFLQVLDFNIIAGEAKTAFQDLESIVLTKATAIRYFGEEALAKGEVIGKTILFGGEQAPRHVTAIVDPPAQTHFPFDMLVNIHYGYDEIGELDNWAWNVMHTYIKVQEAVHDSPERLAALSDKLQQIADRYGKPYMESNAFGPSSQQMIFSYELQPVTDIHLHSHLLREHTANGSIATVYSLMAIAGFIILLACINFMNLSTARATRRAREVGVRKVLGSTRNMLVIQFLSESFIFSVIAVVLALGLVEAFRIPFNRMSGKHLVFDWFDQPALLAAIGVGTLLLSFLAGSYPAFYLAAFRPVSVLKGQIAHHSKASQLRNVLVTFQFAVSIVLIICTALVVQQLRFMQQRDIGYDRENVVVIKNDREIQDQWKTFKEALAQQTSVMSASFTTGLPAQPLSTVRDFRKEGASSGQGIPWFLVDEDYLKTLQLTLVQGRNFRQDMASDAQGILLNEAAVRALGLENPIGETLIKNAGADDEERVQVLGVVKDFHLESFQYQVKPLALQYYRPDYLSDFVAVRIAPGGLPAALAQLESSWKRFEPENPFVYSFLDQDFDTLFNAEQRLGKVLGVFTGLAILIACLGLFGLAAFMAEQRTKEIGIRKVMGASVSHIVQLLSQDFIKLAVISFVIAVPLAYGVMQQWLANFAYRIPVGFGIFILAGATALLIVWLTVSYQSVKAALANPVDSLRDE